MNAPGTATLHRAEVDLSIEGMTCAACASRIEKVLNRLPQVAAAVNFATERAHIEFNPETSGLPALIDAVRKAGYDARPHEESVSADASSEQSRRAETRALYASIVLTLPLAAQMLPMAFGRHDLILPLWLQLALATPVQFWIGARFYASAWHALRGGGANMDVLIALGTSAAWFYSAFVTLAGAAGHVYFEASATIITLVLLGKALQSRARRRASEAIHELIKLQPPLARAVQRAAEKRGLTAAAVGEFESTPGLGVRAKQGDSDVLLGSLRFAEMNGVVVDKASVERLPQRGQTVIVVAIDAQPLGLIAVADRLRASSPEAITRLKKLGIEVIMLTGDNEAAASEVAAACGITNVVAGTLPAEKLAVIERNRSAGHTVGMVGDGVNDAPALAAADVSFAIGSGTGAAIPAADITLMRNDLSSVTDAIDLSRATLTKVRQNLFFAFVYNVLGIPLAAFGLLNPVVAGAAMALSSVSVVSNSLLLRRWRPQPAKA